MHRAIASWYIWILLFLVSPLLSRSVGYLFIFVHTITPSGIHHIYRYIYIYISTSFIFMTRFPSNFRAMRIILCMYLHLSISSCSSVFQRFPCVVFTVSSFPVSPFRFRTASSFHSFIVSLFHRFFVLSFLRFFVSSFLRCIIASFHRFFISPFHRFIVFPSFRFIVSSSFVVVSPRILSRHPCPYILHVISVLAAWHINLRR